MCRNSIYLILSVVVLVLSTGPFAGTAQADLIGHWKFDESSGITAADSAGGDNDGTLIGDELAWVEGRSGGALSHGGLSDARVEFPTTGLSTTAGTVAMWGVLADPQPAQTKYFFGHTTQPQWTNRIQLYMNDGDNLLDLGLGDSHNRQNDIVELPMEEWVHVALTWDSGRYLVYVNGEIDSRAGGGAGSPYLRQLTLRGKFTVTDPQRVRGLGLTMRYRGGVVVYLNGKELFRQHMPAGPVRPGSPAEMYSPDVCLNPKGRPWGWWADRKAIRQKSYPFRARKIDWLAIPSRELSKGTNVLAIEIHAAPYPAPFASAKARCSWATCGLIELHLQAAKPDGLVPNVRRPSGFQVWNSDPLAADCDLDWGDPCEPLRPIRLFGARNGRYSGKVIVGSTEPIVGLRAEASDLTGPEGRTIPASNVAVRYGFLWGTEMGLTRRDGVFSPPYPEGPALFGALTDAPPAEVPVRRTRTPGLGGAVLPVWVTVRVPAEAPAGLYSGTLRIAARGVNPVEVPLRLEVADWTLPDPQDYRTWVELVEVPDTLAVEYDVPLWSDRHFEPVSYTHLTLPTN